MSDIDQFREDAKAYMEHKRFLDRDHAALEGLGKRPVRPKPTPPKCPWCADTGDKHEPFIEGEMIPLEDHVARKDFGRQFWSYDKGFKGSYEKVPCDCVEKERA